MTYDNVRQTMDDMIKLFINYETYKFPVAMNISLFINDGSKKFLLSVLN
jgi:hypothetical protein